MTAPQRKRIDPVTNGKPACLFEKQLAGETALTLATAKRLHQLSSELAALEPWSFLNDEDLTLLEDPSSREMCYCSIMGALGEVFSLQVYIGDSSYRCFRKMAEGKPITAGEFFASQRGVSVEFVRAAELTAPDRELLRACGHPPRRELASPIFRALRPGYHPWYVTEHEGGILASCIQGVLAFCESLTETGLGAYWQEENVYPFLVPSGEGRSPWEYEIKAVRVSEPPIRALEMPELDYTRIERIQKENYPVQGVFEVDHFYTACPVGRKDERKACLSLGLVIDAETAFAYQPALGTPTQKTGQTLVCAILDAIENARFLPRELRVQRSEFRTILDPLASAIGTSVRVVETLPALNFARKELLTMIGDPGEFVG